MAFEARFPGDCAQCDDPILKGQLVEYNFDDQLQHVLCPESIGLSGKPKPVCPRCFMELPVSLVCGVCDV